MSEFLSPGIFIEEVASGGQTIDSVGTSTMAIVGWVRKGATSIATLVTSPDSFLRTFGTDTKDSLVPKSVSAFFVNGGSRCYVVRVAPSDAVAATTTIPGAITGESYATATVSGTQTKTHATTYRPTASSLVVTWTRALAQVVAANPVASPAEDGAATGPFTFTLGSFPITNDTLTLGWSTVGPVVRSATFTITGGVEVTGGADIGQVSAHSINRTSGAVSFTFTVAPLADTIRVTYTPVGTVNTVTDDGLGAFTGAGIAGTADYTTGALSIVWTGALVGPYNGNAITVSYTGNQWNLVVDNVGVWGNDVKFRLRGNENFLVYGQTTVANVGTYARYDALVLVKNPSTGVYEVKESFEELSFTDAGDAMYGPSVINDSSDLVSITDLGFLNVPSTFKGVSYTAETVGTGDSSLKLFTHTMAHIAVLKTSPLFNYTCVGAGVGTAVADTNGLITGTGLDTTKTNTINYTTGVVTLNFSDAPTAAAFTVNYVALPATSLADYVFSGGLDGTLANITEANVSNFSALKASKLGMYALDRIDEQMQVIIPDFAGNTSVAGDMIDYAEDRRDLFAILTTPKNYSATQAVDWLRVTLARKSKYAAVYWPWVKVANALNNNRPLTMPPVAHVAGIYARTDATKNVAKAPGGTVDGALRGLLGLEHNPDKGERDVVYPARINPLINTPQTGMAVWGVRTISSTNDSFKYVASTRLFIFVEKSIFNSTHSLVFENISSNLFTQIKSTLDSFLLNLYNTNHFAGSSPTQAFSVVCDASNNPPEVINAGQVIVDVAIAPNRPAEFIRFRLSQKALS